LVSCAAGLIPSFRCCFVSSLRRNKTRSSFNPIAELFPFFLCGESPADLLRRLDWCDHPSPPCPTQLHLLFRKSILAGPSYASNEGRSVLSARLRKFPSFLLERLEHLPSRLFGQDMIPNKCLAPSSFFPPPVSDSAHNPLSRQLKPSHVVAS